jgi:hypothetical protein
MPASVLLFPLIFGLAACGPRVTNRNIDALNAQFEAAEASRRSLSIKEVESILGQPTRQESFSVSMQTTKELPGVRYYYEENGNTVELHFIDNKLISKLTRFGEQPNSDGDQRRMPKAATPTPEP